MIREFLASVPGQRPVQFAGQSLRLLDQCRDNAFGILVRNLDQHHVARMALDKRCDITIPRSTDQAPSQWPGTARSSTDGGRSRMDTAFLIWPSPFRFHAGVPGSADRAPRPQVLKKLLFKHAARL